MANFPEGMIVKKPGPNAPSFIKATISIRVDEFTKWMAGNKDAKGWVNLDLKESQKGNLYADKWEPMKKKESEEKKSAKDERPPDMDDQIPF